MTKSFTVVSTARLLKLLLAILAIFLCISLNLQAQSVRGMIQNKYGERLPGANVVWVNTQSGTVTNLEGKFELDSTNVLDKRLLISYVGYQTETVDVTDRAYFALVLKESETLEEVQVVDEQKGTFISSAKAIKTEVITQVELGKSACCDLAGCFNTQATVKPATTNVITNAKELQILGLSGVYNQVLIEGMPLIQGNSYTYGVSSVPGTLVDNIYVAKGSNSVLQGYESISGQINVELKEPSSEKLFLNLYGNSFLEKQLNVNYTSKIGNWGNLLAFHTAQPGGKFDRDEDDFLDLPLLTRYVLYNKWNYRNSNDLGVSASITGRIWQEKRIGGQEDFDLSKDEGSTNVYGQTIKIIQPQGTFKLAYRFDGNSRLAFSTSSFYHDQSSFFGSSSFQAKQWNAYANIQYELRWNNQHEIRTGLSYRHVDLREEIAFPDEEAFRNYEGIYLKRENIPGAFIENNFSFKDDQINVLVGIRVDHHNDFGAKWTPRLLAKYNFTEFTSLRASIGKGWRTINLFSENTNILASARDLILSDELQAEEAWNTGASLTHKYFANDFELQLAVDFYRTDFSNQIFPDYTIDPTKVLVENFTGKSISNGFQAEADMLFYEKVSWKIAYNYLDVYRMIENEKMRLPFNSTHRVTSSFGFKPENDKWHYDLHFHWYGKQRLANIDAQDGQSQQDFWSPSYAQLHTQFTRSWEQWELYVGVENIFDFRQERPIQSWENPFSASFDTANVWGPTKGREFYIGARFRLD